MCFKSIEFFDINLFFFYFEDLCSTPAPRVTLSMWTSTVSDLQKSVNDSNYWPRIGQWSFKKKIKKSIYEFRCVNYYTFADCINQVVMLKCYLGEGLWAKFTLEMSKTIRCMNAGGNILKILIRKWKNQENLKSWFKSMIF